MFIMRMWMGYLVKCTAKVGIKHQSINQSCKMIHSKKINVDIKFSVHDTFLE
jgi:hypothetical protein